MRRICIIGSGPTGVYTLFNLVKSPVPLEIVIFETQPHLGKGTPYSHLGNSREMLANIASIEIPPLFDSLTGWLSSLGSSQLQQVGLDSTQIDERTFYTRRVLGEFFAAQFQQCIEAGQAAGHRITTRAATTVQDIRLAASDIAIVAAMEDGATEHFHFDHVVMATGHNWPEQTEIKPGCFTSPWPASALSTIRNASVGILGTSLSAIDALMTVAARHGTFLLHSGGTLQYHPKTGTEAFNATLMSRKGLLPEADFYCPIPYLPLRYCTESNIEKLLQGGSDGLLDGIFELMRIEISEADPAFALETGLALLTVETFADAYFKQRDGANAFSWAALNLSEAEQNYKAEFTVEWRYAILRMHEVVGDVVRHMNQADETRFHSHLKAVFVDDYAAVPHESIKRLLALNQASKLTVLKLGSDYKLDWETPKRGAILNYAGGEVHFDAFVDATGQKKMMAAEMPFPSLAAQLKQHSAAHAGEPMALIGETAETPSDSIRLDDSFRPLLAGDVCHELYCVSLPMLLGKYPFIQGITSSRELGETVAQQILAEPSAAAKLAELQPA